MKKIGISSFYRREEARLMTMVDRQYCDAVRACGALPVIIPGCEDISLAEEYIKDLDGLLLTGGCDVSPLFYGEEPSPKIGNCSLERDFFDSALLKEAVKKGIPVMGICRGLQIMTAAYGGKLIQDIPSEVKNCLCHDEDGNEQAEPIHSAFLSEPLTDIFGEKALVNSYHHQAVKVLGEGFKVAATAKDGIIEAVYCKEKNLTGIQWHPEKLFSTDEKQKNLFKFALKL